VNFNNQIIGSKSNLLPIIWFFYLPLPKIIITIATSKLHIDELNLFFKTQKCFETKDVTAFYKQFEPEIQQSTINWRVYALVKLGLLKRIGRGKFMLEGSQINFTPDVSSKLKTIQSKLKKEFPFLNTCIWNTSIINEFMRHQPGHFYTIIEVEKDALESVFYSLKDANYAVFLNPTRDVLVKYLPNNKDVLIIKSLVTEAPILNIKGFNTISLEKMLVDIYCDNVIFSAQQGSEMRTIFENALTKYAINQSTMIRYANRKGKKENFTQYLNTISN